MTQNYQFQVRFLKFLLGNAYLVSTRWCSIKLSHSIKTQKRIVKVKHMITNIQPSTWVSTKRKAILRWRSLNKVTKKLKRKLKVFDIQEIKESIYFMQLMIQWQSIQSLQSKMYDDTLIILWLSSRLNTKDSNFLTMFIMQSFHWVKFNSESDISTKV